MSLFNKIKQSANIDNKLDISGPLGDRCSVTAGPLGDRCSMTAGPLGDRCSMTAGPLGDRCSKNL